MSVFLIISNLYIYLNPSKHCQSKSLDTDLLGVAIHLHPTLVDCVLPPAGRNHPPHLPRRTPPRKIRALHHDPRYIQVDR